VKDLDRRRSVQKFELAGGKSGTIRDGEFLKEKSMSFPPVD